MAFGNLSHEPELPTTPESLTSIKNLLRALVIGRQEVQSYIDGAMETLRLADEQIAVVSSRLGIGEEPNREELETLEGIASKASIDLEPEGSEWPFYHAVKSCRFLLGQEFEMNNGDLYRERVLVATHDERCAENERVRELRNNPQVEWSLPPQSITETLERQELLEAIAAMAIDNGFPGEVFQSLGITNKDGKAPIKKNDTDHLAGDVQTCWLIVYDAQETKKRKAREESLKRTRHAVLKSIGRA